MNKNKRIFQFSFEQFYPIVKLDTPAQIEQNVQRAIK